MAFLDNSGDIILDAVLTDTGRKRLAKGDGSFKIDKFALADDEIDYSLYENGHEGGPAYNNNGNAHFDLNIMMTPILEAFTNNASSMKSKLISLVRDDLWYLPELILAAHQSQNKTFVGFDVHVVAVDQDTVDQWAKTATDADLQYGVLNGKSPVSTAESNYIRVEQGLNHVDTWNTELDPGLKETQYIIEMDNRFGVLTDLDGNEQSVSYIDDDNIASYYVTPTGTFNSRDIVDTTTSMPNHQEQDAGKTLKWKLVGARGTAVRFKVRSSISLSTSETLFNKIGSTTGTVPGTVVGDGESYIYIDTNIRITGATTGASIDIPVRYVKKPA